MKTLREMLLEKHREADPKLDLIRKTALSTLNSEAIAAKDTQDNTNWLAWLLSMRWHLAGLTAAWILVGWLNADKQAATQTTGAMAGNDSPQYVLLALKENRRQLQELIEPPSTQTTPKPRRRTELQTCTEIV